MPRVARKVRVTGRVQGVFFRAWTQQQARKLGVSGWVRNAADGSVNAHIEGEEGAVEQLTEQMRHGPSGARVDHLESEHSETESLDRFEIRH